METDRGYILLSSALFPPPLYYALMLHAPMVRIEHHEHYLKQSFRNRFIINANENPSSLIIPVKKVNGNHTLITDIEIDYHDHWPRLFAKTLETAYANSPFFEYLKYDIFELFDGKPRYLTDLNQSALELMKRWLNIHTPIEYSLDFESPSEKPHDWRYKLSPKMNNGFIEPPYQQGISKVFIPNLSILDLLFNKGLESREYLQNWNPS